MKFKDLDGNIHNKDISDYKWSEGGASRGERELGERLTSLFPNLTIYSQLPCFGTRLKIDFVIISLRLAFEFDGNQHEEYVPHFHRTRKGFQRSKDRDWEKEEWCKNNKIRLLRVKTSDIDCLEELIHGD